MCENAHFLVLRSPPLAQYEPDHRATSQSSSPIYVARIALIKTWGHLVRFRHTSQFRQNGCFGPNTLNRHWSPPAWFYVYAVQQTENKPPITTKRESKTSADSTIGPHASLGHVFIARARQQKRGGGWGGQKYNKTDQLSGIAGVCDVGSPRFESREATFFSLARRRILGRVRMVRSVFLCLSLFLGR